MVGTFYRGPSPDSPPFVDIGATVNEDTVVCIIEAMKVMNEIKAETGGVVAEILVENGKPVQFGQALVQSSLNVARASSLRLTWFASGRLAPLKCLKKS